ncbi:hypothetical protein QMO56_09055 [Roseomonas sp. E05]|uniref:hypothetical protein n=1 Tax=Roseomonas sp. E05 TaxID=3046310 RepID=UPI0024B97FBB|nr:hypothetical protein [Roseomonas sp. E05]MDJ0388260.1 hypothetical protein [Roseomonas sp. E05]
MIEVSSGRRISKGLRQKETGRVAALALLLGLGACAASFTGERTEPIPASLTVQRVLGEPPGVQPLQPVPGNVWPEEDLERRTPTMSDPDLLQRAPMDAPPPHRPIPSGSSTPPALLQQQGYRDNPYTPSAQQAPGAAPSAPIQRAEEREQRRDGQVIPTPEGPVVTSGGGRNYRTYNRPGGGSGIAIPNGASTTLLDADGTVRQVPTPR